MKHSLSSPTSRLVGCALTIALSACSSTRVVTQWQDPATTRITFTKVLSLAVGGDRELVRTAEENLCLQVKRAPCKPAYFAMPDSMRSDIPAAKKMVRDEGFDGALIFRVMSAETQVAGVPPRYGPGFWGYYGYAQASVPQSYRANQRVRVETAIYSITQDKVLWMGVTETLNPDSLDTLVQEVGKAVRQELEREGALPAS